MLIGNLQLETSEDELSKFFATVGKVASVQILKDKQGRGRGFAFVTMAKAEHIEAAVEKMHNAEFKGRILSVSPVETTQKQKRKSSLFGLFGFCR
jgi:RNA recognition motif-containing protein